MGYHVSIQTGETQKQGGNKTVRQLKAESQAVKQLPEGKQALLGKNKSYTQEEDRILREKAELGVAYETEIAVRQDLKRLQEQKTYALNKKDTDLNLREKELLKKKQELCIREEQLNYEHMNLERVYARKMEEAEVAPELLQKLEHENRSMREVLYAIFQYFGSRIINSIPGVSDRIKVDGLVREEPSAAFMDMVENCFIKPLREALGNAEQIIGNIREAVLDMLKGLHVLNYRGYGNEKTKDVEKDFKQAAGSIFGEDEIKSILKQSRDEMFEEIQNELY